MKRLASTWLNGEEIVKSADGMGRVLTDGRIVADSLMKMANVELTCDGQAQHVVKAMDAPENLRCVQCARYGKRSKLHLENAKAKDDDGDADDMSKSESIDSLAKRVSERITRRKTGGMLDGRPIYDQQMNRVKQPFVREP